MKIKIALYISFISLLPLLGCNDWLDVNTDPNNLSELDNPEAVLPVAQVGLANALMGWHMGFTGAFWSQYWTQDHTSSQFKYLDEYDETSLDYAYDNLVPSALNDLKAIKDNSEEGSGNYLVAEALSIFGWQIVTDTWGDIPYFNALLGNEGNFSPAFDAQEDIYEDLMARVDALLEMDFSEALIDSDYDFIYQGDVDAWLAFVKSLKLKLMIRLSETPNFNLQDAVALASSGGFISETAMIPGSVWEDRDTKRHPMVEFHRAGYFDNVIASMTMIRFLTTNNDPRIDLLYIAPGEEHQGALQGDFGVQNIDTDGDGTDDDEEDYSIVQFDVDADIPLMSTWEVNFYLAEVYARANDPRAKVFYDAAVEENLTYWGIGETITGEGQYAEWPDGTVEENIRAIALQKWVAYNKLQHMEAFFERNRTKYPAVNELQVRTAAHRQELFNNFPVGDFIISVAGVGKLSGDVPSSPIYPNAVITRNTTKPQQKTSLAEDVWWDQKAGK
jgi:hypothetical protein